MATGTRWQTGTTAKTTTNARIRSVADSSASSSTVLYQANTGTVLYLISEVVGTDNYYWYWCKHNTDTSKPQGYVRCDLISGTKASGGTGGSTGGSGTGVNTASWADVVAGRAVYKKESSGSAVCAGVKTLQQYLKKIGYGANNVGAIVEDGNFGTITENAVKAFQKEMGYSTSGQDGVVGSQTASALVAAQTDSRFTNSNYFPINASLLTYSNYPYTEQSLVARIICAEHGYVGTGHSDGRAGVAKVLKNRKDKGGVTLYDNSKTRDYKNVIFGKGGQYTTATSPLAYRVARGTTAFTEAVTLATQICNGTTPSGAPLVVNQLFQKGKGAWDSSYTSKAGYCRYPASGSNYSFFYN